MTASKITMKRKFDHIFTLRRLHPKLGEVTTWEVLTADEKMRLGVIRRVKDAYLIKRLGWRELPVYYWLGSAFWTQTVAVGSTQRSVLMELFPQYYRKAYESDPASSKL